MTELLNPPTVRPATLVDLPRVVEMIGHFVEASQYRAFVDLASEHPASVAAFAIEAGGSFLAERDGLVIGMISGVVLTNPLTGSLFVDELVWWVEPAHRHLKVGPRLLQALEGWAGTKGALMLKMVAPSGSDVGRYLTRVGYEAPETTYIKRLTG